MTKINNWFLDINSDRRVPKWYDNILAAIILIPACIFVLPFLKK